ncbi:MULTISPECIES: 16S rRNA (guanine(966)-N(2))-methyltransferase RsmD [unclassified Duganella]|uniref:16S rRNA (guanine(966)-N(2))-methyltransferase RsmD n=1 Tax=unclassified Duganella TaxID=2636909 RepID=UPI0008852326|nr:MULTISPECIES: 16S rRNA (guanine(966)-N(2))-methyltransferase RsmD [unclassified Duganella]SDG88892.1 16S rRNA (guanine(966)-N(2))-methyltransferase RsmD [Duganella sp. OV458]SDJ53195.1 16S rRNA (guanine(966)-N(2))-methyltransferase RsmD [Duganella sp. OV510]
MPRKPLSKPAKPAKVPVHGPQHSNQVRIIGGQWKRTPLPVLSALGLRPTPDRVRETAFNWINHQRDGYWADAQVLDLFAGSGALGFEAASRGALSVTMIDSNAQVTRQLEEIKAKLKADNVQIMRGDALSVAQSAATRGQKYDLIFLDPPYQQSFLEKTLPLCGKLLKEGGLVYAESGLALEFADGEAVPEWLANWEVIRADKAGMVFYHLLKYKP